jgi:hypothetical protein
VVKKKKEERPMKERLLEWLKPFSDRVPDVVTALVVFVVGWMICKLIQKAVSSVLAKFKLDEWLNRKTEEKPIKIEPVISKLVYYILLVYVLVITLNILKVGGDVLAPVTGMFEKFVSMIPNIVGAAFIAFLGYVLAKIVGSIVRAAATGLDPLASKAGLGKSASISKLLGQLVFIVIFIPTVIAALDTLKIDAISGPALELVRRLSQAIPSIIAAALVLVVSYVVGRLVTGFLAELLSSMGADVIPEKVGAKALFGKISFSTFCGRLAFFFIMLAAAEGAVEYLRMENISTILTELLTLSGKVVLGLIILGIGNFIAVFAQEKLSKSLKSPILPLVARISIMFIVLAMGLHTMGVARDIIEMTFMFTLGTLSLTIILAFGIGGRAAAGQLMDKWLAKLMK